MFLLFVREHEGIRKESIVRVSMKKRNITKISIREKSGIRNVK